MKPSSFLNEIKSIELFDSNINIISSTNKDFSTLIQLNQVSQNISNKIKSHIFSLGFLNQSQAENQDIMFKLLAIRLKTSVRNIKNPNYVKSRKEQYEQEIKLIDNYVDFHIDFKTFTNSINVDKEFKRQLINNHLFFINISNFFTKKNISQFFYDDFSIRDTKENNLLYLNMSLRTLEKMQRITETKVYIGINETEEIIKSLDINKLMSIYFIKENHIEISNKKIYFNKNEELIQFDRNQSLKVDPETGLFCRLQNEDILNLKELLISVSRNRKLIKEDYYIRTWLDNYTKNNNIEEFLSKAYLSIANKLEVKAE